jgi:hypothetical protein
MAPSVLALALHPPELGPVDEPASTAPGGDCPGGKAWEKHSMFPFASAMQQRSGWPPWGVCHPGGHAPHVVGPVGHGVGGQSHGGHAPESGSHAGQAQEPPQPGVPPLLPPPAQAVAPLLSVSQHVSPDEPAGVYMPGGQT